jgi:hypothetical protein
LVQVPVEQVVPQHRKYRLPQQKPFEHCPVSGQSVPVVQAEMQLGAGLGEGGAGSR